MAKIPYVTGGAWWTAARMNELFEEFDRKLTKALAGKTPYLLCSYGRAGSQILPGNLPMADETDPNLPPRGILGFGPPTGWQRNVPSFGSAYIFTGPHAPVVYCAHVEPWNQSNFLGWAASLPVVVVDLVNSVIRVAGQGPSPSPYRLDQSLSVAGRYQGDQFLRYWEQDGVPDRALRYHRYAVAEIVCEGLREFTLDLTCNRYSNFRFHNLSGIPLTVTVIRLEPGDPVILTVPPFGVRAVRREANYLDASFNYCFKYRAGMDYRFYLPLGGGHPETSAAAGNLARPQVIFDWFNALGGQLDPLVQLPSEFARYSPILKDANNGTNLIGDLLTHRGEIRSVGWVSPGGNDVRVGAFKGWGTLEQDLAPLGVTVSQDEGDNFVLSRADGDAPGEPAAGLDLFAPGTNLLWCPAQDLSASGSPPGSVDERVRQYTPLPVQLISRLTIETINERYISSVSTGTNQVTEVGVWGLVDSPTFTWASSDQGRSLSVSFRQPAKDIAAQLQGNLQNKFKPWVLTSLGWLLPIAMNYSVVHAYTQMPPGFSLPDLSLWDLGIYDALSGTTTTRNYLIRLAGPGWSTHDNPNMVSPLKERIFGALVGGATWTTQDWDGIQVQPDGTEPKLIGKPTVPEPGLKYLSNPGPPFTIVDAVVAARYGVALESDEARSALEAYRSDWRVKYAQGQVYPDKSLFLRRRMQVEDFNHLAWIVNGWNRSRPVVDISRLWLRREQNFDGVTHLEPDNRPPFARAGIFPADCYRKITADEKALYEAMGIAVHPASDAPGWPAARAALFVGSWWQFQDQDLYTNLRTPNSDNGDGTFHVQQIWDWQRRYGAAQRVDAADSDQNFDYDLYSPLTETNPWYFIRAADVQALADSLGLPMTWINAGVALKLTTRPMAPPTRTGLPAVAPQFINDYPFVDFFDVPNVTIPPDGNLDPRTNPNGTLNPDPPRLSDYVLADAMVRLEAATTPAELGWIAQNLAPNERWLSEAFLWKNHAKQKDGAWIETNNVAAGIFVQGFAPETLERDAQAGQSWGAYFVSTHPGVDAASAQYLFVGTYGWDYTEDFHYNFANDGTPVPYVTFTTSGGGSGVLTAGPNLVLAPAISTAQVIRLVGLPWVDLGTP